MCRTPQTCPTRRVCGVRDKGKGQERAGHHKHAHEGMFVVLETRGGGGNAPDTTNTPTRRVRGVRDEGKGQERVGHHKRAHEGVFVVFEMRGGGGNALDTTNTPHKACLWCSR